MRTLPRGPLFGNPRYSIIEPGHAGGAFLLSEGEMRLDALASAGPEGRVPVLVKSIDYDRTWQAGAGETIEGFVTRRRDELRREVALLGHYKRATAHLSQLIDVVEGENTWSAALASSGLASGEPCLVMERIEAERLSSLAGAEMSVEETLHLCERVLRLLRVFHSAGRNGGEERFFLSLSPADILIEPATRKVWLDNIYKLKTAKELPEHGIVCPRTEHAFVSSLLAGWLRPPATVAAPPQTGQTFADLDLYSLAVVLFWVLEGDPDLTDEPPGFLDDTRIASLADRRALPDDVRSFLDSLAMHRFHTAHAALSRVCEILGKPAPEPFRPPAEPRVRQFKGDGQYGKGDVLGGRYEIRGGIAEGAQGRLYWGRDRRTGGRVAIKTAVHPNLVDRSLVPGAVRAARACVIEEALHGVRMHSRVGSVPAIVDVFLTRSVQKLLSDHPDESLHGPHEPVIVMEYLAGDDFSMGIAREQLELLQTARAICGIVVEFHRDDRPGGTYLFMDWKPLNMRWHPESESCSLLDLGAMRSISDSPAAKFPAHSPPYHAPELTSDYEKVPLTPAFDIYGFSAIVWELAVRPDPERKKEIFDLREKIYQERRQERVFPAAEVPDSHAELRSILERALEPDYRRRYSSAKHMLQAIDQALGRVSKMLPEAPIGFAGRPTGAHEVGLTLRLPRDPHCTSIVVLRGSDPVDAYSADRVKEIDLATHTGSRSVSIQDAPPAGLTRVHYAAFSVGLNGLRSRLVPCVVDMLVDPEKVWIEREELALRIRWTVPAIARLAGGEVVVESRGSGGGQIYAGRDDGFLDERLSPGVTREYRVFCRLPSGESPGVIVKGLPYPALSRLRSLAIDSGERELRLRWTMSAGAAERLVILRSGRPVNARDIEEALAGEQAASFGLSMNGEYQVVGLAEPSDAVLQPGDDGDLCGEWVDGGVRPGAMLHYTPVLVYEDQRRVGAAREGIAYAEADDLSARGLPCAARLTWRTPVGTDEIEVRRDGAMFTLAAGERALLDRGLPPGRSVDYRVRLRFGPVWSAGRDVSATPTDPMRALPRLTAVAGDRRLTGSADLRGLPGPARVVVTSGDAQVTVLPLHPDPGGSGRFEAEGLLPGRPVVIDLVDDAGATLESVEVEPFAEVSDLQVRGGGRCDMEVAWRNPEYATGAIVLLDGLPITRSVPPGGARCAFKNLAPGRYRAFVHSVTPSGFVSRGVPSGYVEIEDPAGRAS